LIHAVVAAEHAVIQLAHQQLSDITALFRFASLY